MHATVTASIAAALLGVAAVTAQAQPMPAPPPARAVCNDCGTVQSMRLVEQKGQGSGVGAVAGGVLGGVLGHQIGSGRGNTVATIAGAAGGAVVGNEVEKNRNTKSFWEVSLRMDSGSYRTFTYGSKPAVREGERVKLVDGGRRLALLAN